MSLAISRDAFAWMKKAACQGKESKFFGDGARSLLAARKICSHCPVQQACEDYGRELLVSRDPINSGLWGGKTPAELKQEMEQEKITASRKGILPKCAWAGCNNLVPPNNHGKPRLYCGSVCKKKAEIARSKARA